MHGRLKVKTSEQQEKERKKEKDAKAKKYIAGFKNVCAKRSENACDDEALHVGAQLLLVNPDSSSLWNYRREIIETLRKTKGKDYIDKLEESELNVTENCLLSNHKSYGAWYQRRWILSTSLNSYWNKEMEVCDQYLSKDERNFHCWDHRRIVVRKSDRTTEEELKYTQKLIEENLSNYSAWHYRSKLLPIVHPPLNDSPHPVDNQIFIQELDRVISAIFTDPGDQSPWFFLKWLLAHETQEKVVKFGIVNGEDTQLIALFNSPVDSIEKFKINVGQLDESRVLWMPNCSNCIWSCKITLSEAQNGISITVGESEKSISLKLKSSDEKSSFSHWLVEDLGFTPKLSDATTKSLNELYENCVLLDSVDSGNKWVLLTMVNVMWSLDSSKYFNQILETLENLRKIDCLRDNYYRDIASKLQMEIALSSYIKNEQDTFSLTNCNLSRITSGHLLYFSKKVDLSGNNLRCLKPVWGMAMCNEMVLDGNIFEDLEPLERLKNLDVVSLKNCGIKGVDQLKWTSKRNLKRIFFEGNHVPQGELEDFLEGSMKSVFCLR